MKQNNNYTSAGRFLGRRPSDIGLSEYDLDTFDKRCKFVDEDNGRQASFALPNDITLWTADDFQGIEDDKHLNVIVDFGKEGYVEFKFGNVYFAGTDEKGGTVPLTKAQLDFLIDISTFPHLRSNHHTVMKLDVNGYYEI